MVDQVEDHQDLLTEELVIQGVVIFHTNFHHKVTQVELKVVLEAQEVVDLTL